MFSSHKVSIQVERLFSKDRNHTSASKQQSEKKSLLGGEWKSAIPRSQSKDNRFEVMNSQLKSLGNLRKKCGWETSDNSALNNPKGSSFLWNRNSTPGRSVKDNGHPNQHWRDTGNSNFFCLHKPHTKSQLADNDRSTFVMNREPRSLLDSGNRSQKHSSSMDHRLFEEKSKTKAIDKKQWTEAIFKGEQTFDDIFTSIEARQKNINSSSNIRSSSKTLLKRNIFQSLAGNNQDTAPASHQSSILKLDSSGVSFFKRIASRPSEAGKKAATGMRPGFAGFRDNSNSRMEASKAVFAAEKKWFARDGSFSKDPMSSILKTRQSLLLQNRSLGSRVGVKNIN